MPTHLLLEGPDIESVLSRLRDDHGPDAKIVQAELVRTGGFAGFFAKRRYEVTVEVDDEVVTGPVDASSGPAVDILAEPMTEPPQLSGIDALLSAAEGQDLAEVGGLAVPIAAPGIPAQGWHRPVSTEGEAFSDILGSLAARPGRARSRAAPRGLPQLRAAGHLGRGGRSRR